MSVPAINLGSDSIPFPTVLAAAGKGELIGVTGFGHSDIQLFAPGRDPAQLLRSDRTSLAVLRVLKWNELLLLIDPHLMVGFRYDTEAPEEEPIEIQLPRGRLEGEPIGFPDSSFVFSGRIPTRDRAGLPFHYVTGSGEVRSFGEQAAENGVGVGGRWPSRLGQAGDTAFWAYSPTAYRLEKWDRDGRRLASFSGELQESISGLDASTPSSTRHVSVSGVREDAEGLLWVLILVRDTQRRAESPVASDQNPVSSGAPPDVTLAGLVVEVIDLAGDSVYARRTFPAWQAVPIPGSGAVAEPVTGSDGSSLLQLWALRLRAKEAPLSERRIR